MQSVISPRSGFVQQGARAGRCAALRLAPHSLNVIRHHFKKILVMKKIFLVILVMIITGCDASLVTGNRSGSVDDDYIEEPIGQFSLQYENALATSNEIVDLLIQKNYKKIHTEYVHQEAKDILSEDVLADLQAKLSSKVGEIKKYKKMQWGFLPATEKGKKLLVSFKIVEHDKLMFNYAFVFEDDGKYKRIVGLQINERKGPRFPNNIK